MKFIKFWHVNDSHASNMTSIKIMRFSSVEIQFNIHEIHVAYMKSMRASIMNFSIAVMIFMTVKWQKSVIFSS